MTRKDERLARSNRLTVLSSGLAMIIALVFMLLHQHVVSRSLMLEELRTEAAIVGANSAAALLFNDTKAAQETINTVRLSPRLHGGALYRSDGTRLAWAGEPPSDGVDPQDPYPAHLPEVDVLGLGEISLGLMREEVRVDGTRVGSLLLGVDFRPLHVHLLSYALGLLVIALAACWLAYRLTHGVRQRMALAEAKLAQLAFYDPVTGLPNRRLFQRELTLAVARVARERIGAALIYIDLDDFKRINDTLGHAAGDEVLTCMGERLTRTLRSGDVVARLGGDEFGVILYGVDTPESVAKVAALMIDGARAPLTVPAAGQLGLSMGVVLLPCDVTDIDVLMSRADMAMYLAKSQGKNSYHFFSEEINARMRAEARLESRLDEALTTDGCGLSMVYQPQIDAQTGALCGVEALLRWQHDDGTTVSPVALIAVAERSGLIAPLGDWVLAQVCRDLAWLHTQGVDLPRVSVNVSARQLARGTELVHAFCRTLATFDQPVARFELELTESAFMDEQGMVVLQALHQAGFALSMDDFGTGYSSLGYLKRFQIDELKIDRVFVSDVPHGPENVAIVAAVVQMSRALHLRVVAEGVETAEQAAALRDMGCDVLQGYGLARPLTAQALVAWVLAQNGL